MAHHQGDGVVTAACGGSDHQLHADNQRNMVQEHDTGKYEAAHKEQKHAARLTSGRKATKYHEQARKAAWKQSMIQLASLNEAFGALHTGAITATCIVNTEDSGHIVLPQSAVPGHDNQQPACPITLCNVHPIQRTAAGGASTQRLFYVVRISQLGEAGQRECQARLVSGVPSALPQFRDGGIACRLSMK